VCLGCSVGVPRCLEPPQAVPQLGSRAFPERAWRLRAARHSQGESSVHWAPRHCLGCSSHSRIRSCRFHRLCGTTILTIQACAYGASRAASPRQPARPAAAWRSRRRRDTHASGARDATFSAQCGGALVGHRAQLHMHRLTGRRERFLGLRLAAREGSCSCL
jgi:hypothetical protein